MPNHSYSFTHRSRSNTSRRRSSSNTSRRRSRSNTSHRRIRRNPSHRRSRRNTSHRRSGGTVLDSLKIATPNTTYLNYKNFNYNKAFYLQCTPTTALTPTGTGTGTGTPTPTKSYFFVFEKIYDCKLPSKIHFTRSYNLRWFYVQPSEINFRHSDGNSPFGPGGKYSYIEYASRLKTHNLYMVYLVECEDIIGWFGLESIDSKNIHITMLAFVPIDYSSTPYAVHFYIDKEMWKSEKKKSLPSLPGLSIKLHGFSATAITKINKTGRGFKILSSPNDTMTNILLRDIRKKHEYYKLPSDNDKFYQEDEWRNIILQDYITDGDGNNIQISSVNPVLSPWNNICIDGMRLKQRFEGEINPDLKTEIKNLYFWLENKTPPENCLDELYKKLCGDKTAVTEAQAYIRCMEVLKNINKIYVELYGEKSLENEYEQLRQLCNEMHIFGNNTFSSRLEALNMEWYGTSTPALTCYT